MAVNIDKKDMGYLGEEFQYRLIHHFFANKDFFKDISSILDQNMFTNPTLKQFVGWMKEHYKIHDTVPSYDIMGVMIRTHTHTDLDVEQSEAILNEIKNKPDEDPSYVEEVALKFFKQQHIVKTANEILRIAGNGDADRYEKCAELLSEAIHQGVHNDEGIEVFSDIGEVLSDDYRIPIPTGILQLDKALEGGIGKGELGVIVGPTSFGKALSVNELVLTPSGFKLARDIKIGDKLIGKNGSPTNVIGVFPQGVRPIYKVKFTDGTYYECDKEHILPVNTYWQRSGKKYIKGVSKGRNDKRYMPDLSFKNMTLREIIDKGLYRSGHRHNFAVPNCNPVELDEVKVEIDPYILGVLIGDGCFTCGSFYYSTKDSIIKENVLNLLPSNFEYSERINNKNLVEVHLFKPFWDVLGKHIDLGLHSYDKYIPNEYLYNSKENRIKLLQGLMDTDGFISKAGYCGFTTKSKRLAEDFLTLVRSLGGVGTVREKQSGYFSKKLNERVECGIVYDISFGLFDSSIQVSSLERKQSKVRYLTNSKFHKFIDDVEFVREEDAVCFLVDAEDHLFLTRDFNVTHNTSLTTAIASYASTFRCEANENQGFKVLQIVFEDRIKQIQRKHLARIVTLNSGQVVESKDLSKPEFRELVRSTFETFADKDMMNANLRIIRLPNGDVTASQIKRLIKKLTNNGFKPDLVIVDYFECLDTNADAGYNVTNEWEKEGKTMRKFESMANELNIAMWIPSQGTKESISAELVTMDKMGGSVKKAQIAHIILSIARTTEDIENNKATMSILKNRSGKAGCIFKNVNFNNGTCVIECNDDDDMLTAVEFGMEKSNNIMKSTAELKQQLRMERAAAESYSAT